MKMCNGLGESQDIHLKASEPGLVIEALVFLLKKNYDAAKTSTKSFSATIGTF